MSRIERLTLQAVEFIPDHLESGVLYYSEKYGCANHLCACGCGHQAPIPVGDAADDWKITITDGEVTLSPSLLHRFECRSHYLVENGLIRWA